MRTFLLVALVVGLAAAAPVASAECPPDEPCDPPPMPLCPPLTDLDPSRPVGWLKDWVACWR